MLYKIQEGGLEEVAPDQWQHAEVLVISNEYAQRKAAFPDSWHSMSSSFFQALLNNKEIRFESHVDFDLICVPSFVVKSENPLDYPLYLLLDQKQVIILTHEKNQFEEYLKEMYSVKGELTPAYIVYYILESLIEHEEKRVEEMEQEVSDWEEKAIKDLDSDAYIREIIRFRKHLLVLKHFYEHLKRAIEYAADNENRLLEAKIVKRFKILEDRSVGMYEDIQVLREEVMQLKEGYQAQRDLEMNRTMRFLTVVTTIFMPLTLLAGWYGMNLQMPEYEQPWAYPILIVLSILIVLAGIWLCRKKKWF